MKSGCFQRDYFHFKEIKANVGFIASVGCSNYIAPHCHGACGVSSRNVLIDVKSANYSDILGRGHLPFWYVLKPGADGHELNGEVRFTNAIHQLGFDLVNSRNEKFLVNWLETELRNCHGEAVRMVEWDASMARSPMAFP